MKLFQHAFFSAITFFIVLIGSAYALTAQDQEVVKKIEFGLRLMPTFTSLKVQTASGSDVRGQVALGFGAGAFLGYNFTNQISVIAEIMYSSIAQKSSDNTLNRKINLQYVNIPILFSLNTGKTKSINLNAVLGPQVGFNVGSKLSISGNNDVNIPQPVLSVKKNDIGFVYGAGVDFGVNPANNMRVGLGYRGVVGLVDISDKNKNVTTDSYYLLDRTNIKTYSGYVGFSILF